MIGSVPRVLVCTTVIHLSQKKTNTMIGSLRLIDLSTDFCQSLDLHCFKNSQHSNTWDRMCFLDILVKSWCFYINDFDFDWTDLHSNTWERMCSLEIFAKSWNFYILQNDRRFLLNRTRKDLFSCEDSSRSPLEFSDSNQVYHVM